MIPDAVRPLEDFDGAAVRRLADGDRPALEECFRRFANTVYRVARGILGQAQDADDAVQEIFLRVHEKAAKYEGHGSFEAWLKRVAVRHSLNLLEKRRREHERVDPVRLESLAGTKNPDAQPSIEHHEELQRILDLLPDEFRTVLVLRELAGLSYREIAEHLQVPVGTVMSRLARARERLLGIPARGGER